MSKAKTKRLRDRLTFGGILRLKTTRGLPVGLRKALLFHAIEMRRQWLMKQACNIILSDEQRQSSQARLLYALTPDLKPLAEKGTIAVVGGCNLKQLVRMHEGGHSYHWLSFLASVDPDKAEHVIENAKLGSMIWHASHELHQREQTVAGALRHLEEKSPSHMRMWREDNDDEPKKWYFHHGNKIISFDSNGMMNILPLTPIPGRN